jgi:lipopolysaccharide/colanic/teichoic acid biosynthesis glycosyltransferase
LLRATSFDELPQLVNVLRGEMSLVGPRPALPSEVDQFDDRLLVRHDVSPGVTGLWQVEARDVPGLGAYTRLDLFYVENWSVMLDLTIIASTVTHIVARAVRIIVGRDAGAH